MSPAEEFKQLRAKEFKQIGERTFSFLTEEFDFSRPKFKETRMRATLTYFSKDVTIIIEYDRFCVLAILLKDSHTERWIDFLEFLDRINVVDEKAHQFVGGDLPLGIETIAKRLRKYGMGILRRESEILSLVFGQGGGDG